MDDIDDNGSDSEFKLQINTQYAENYEKWRAKEEYQKLKDKYGDVNLDAIDDDDESDSSSTEDEDAEELTPTIQKDFLRTLAALKSRDPKIYDPKVNFFIEKSDEDDKKEETKSRKVKPMYLKDYEREVILKKEGKFSDDENNSDQEEESKPLSYYQEQDAIRQSFKNAYSSDEDAENLLSVRVKSRAEQEKEEEEYLEWLKGQKEDLPADKNTEAELNPLRQFWANPSLDEGEQFLRDYLLQKQYLQDNDEKQIPSYDEVIRELEEEDKELDKEEQFEKKYNFRFEEPDAELVKSYPRVIPESLRNKDTRRIEHRKMIKERKKQEEIKKREEIKRFKNMKRMEIMNKIEKLKEVTGNSALGFSENDIEEEFDAEHYDRMMKKVFDEDYYGEEDDKKPVFSDMEDDEPDWNQWTGQEQGQENDDYDGDNYDLHCDDPDFVMDCDYDPSRKRVKVKTEEKKKKKSHFAAAVEKPKPVFDTKFKSFEQYFDKYYGLNYEDVVGDIPVRFKYREVMPNDYGLSVDEVLSAPDKELNAWVSVKKMSQYTTEDEEMRDLRVFRKKGRNIQHKKNVLSSLCPEDASDEPISEPLTKKRQRDVADVDCLPPKKAKKKKGKADEKQIELGESSGENELTAESSAKEQFVTSKLSNMESGQVDESKTTAKHKKKKKRKTDINTDESVKPTSVENSTVVRTVDVNSSDVNRTKRKKKNSKKLPPISEDRLKAYGISVKKFKYVHSKKLMGE